MHSPFGINFCRECGHVYGVTGQSSETGRNRSPEFPNRPEPEEFIDRGEIIASPSTVCSALLFANRRRQAGLAGTRRPFYTIAASHDPITAE